MSKKLFDILEANYDPSDVDNAQQVAYMAIRLMREAQRAVMAEEGNTGNVGANVLNLINGNRAFNRGQ